MSTLRDVSYFHKGFSPKGDFTSDNFPIGNFPNVQFSKQQLSKGMIRPSEAPQAAMGAERFGLDGLGAKCRDQNRLGGRALQLGQTWKVAAWEIAHLGSCHFNIVILQHNV